MMNTSDAYFLFDSQNYTKKEIAIIYGDLEKVNSNTFDKLTEKAIENDDWRILDHLLKKYDLDCVLRKSSNA